MFKHVIIGGGVTGASIAYHLSKITKGKIAIIEKNTFGSGQTGRAAGLVLHNHHSYLGRKLAAYTSYDINQLKKKHNINYNKTGSVQLCKMINNYETILSPWIRKNNCIRIPSREFQNYNERDGYVNPYDLTMAYIHAAKQSGVITLENTEITHINKDNPNYLTIYHQNDSIQTENIINATGYQGTQFSPLPITNLRSHYWIAQMHNIAPDNLPILLIPGIYLRTYRNLIDIGIQEKQSKIVKEIIHEDNTDILLSYADILKHYIIDFDHLSIQHYIHGISSYTADGLPVIKRERGIISVAGCCGYGITWAGGIGHIIASGNIPSELCASRFDNLENKLQKQMALDIRHNKFK